MDLEGIVARVSEKFGVEPSYMELGHKFLESRVSEWEARNLYHHPVEDRYKEDELLLFYYMRGIVPIMQSDDEVRIRYISDLYLLRPWELGATTKKLRSDDNLFRLHRRISERSRNGNPSWRKMINQVGRAPLLVKFFHRSVSYDDMMPTDELLGEYMTGKRTVFIRDYGKVKNIRILKMDDLRVLGTKVIERGEDENLYRLYRRVRMDHQYRNGPQWSDLVNVVGRRDSVKDHLGMRITYGDAGMPTPGSDKQLLLRYLLGHIPVHTAEGDLTITNIQDLWVFVITSEGHPDVNITRLYYRTHMKDVRGERQPFRKLMNELGTNPVVEARYGRCISYRDAQTQLLIHRMSEELEKIMLGEREVVIGGLKKRIDGAVEDLRLLRPQTQLTDPIIHSIAYSLTHIKDETEVRYYDLVDIVGRRPRVVEAFGRPITRYDVNPKFDQQTRQNIAA